eukprot:10281139-Ditylum_brightwellii.AAC.1
MSAYQTVKALMNMDQLEWQLEFFKASIKIFFKIESLTYKVLNRLYKRVQDERSTFKIMIALDKKL